MKSSGKPSRRKKAVGSIIGAVFLVLIILSGFTFYQLYLNISDHYNGTLQSMGESDWSRNREKIVIKNVEITGSGNLSVTVENDGTLQSHLIWFGIFNMSASPETQAYYPLDISVDPAENKSVVSVFTVVQGKKYAVQLVTELGNTIGFKFYPASEVVCQLTLTTAPPTAYKGNNVTVALTVTHNDSEVDAIQSLTVSLSPTPSGLVQLMDNSSPTARGLRKGESAFFWWIYNTIDTGTVTFNATYGQAPARVYALASLNVLDSPGQGGASTVLITGVNCTAPYNPLQWNLLGSTQNISGSVADLASNDSSYAIFNSYNSGTSTNINHFVDNNSSNVDNSTNIGTHSNFTAQQYGPDLINDTLTEADTKGYTLNDWVDSNTSNVDGLTGHGTSSNFTAQQYTDTINDTLTEENTGGTIMHEYYNTSDDEAGGSAYASYKRCQTLNSTGSFSITSVKLLLYRAGTVGTVTVGIYPAIGSPAYPNTTGSALTSGTMAGSGITTNTAGAWYEITFTAYTIQANINYSIVLSDNGGNSNNVIYWRDDASSPTYNNGEYGRSTSSGVWSTSSMDATRDSMFETWGTSDNYELNYEIQWTSANYTSDNEELCIRTGPLSAETLGVDAWNGASWTNIIASLSANTWNNVSVATYLTNGTITFRYLGGTESGDTVQSTWQIESALLHTWNSSNYELDIEEQFTSVDTGIYQNKELCILAGTWSTSETLKVDVWNTTSNSWVNVIANLTANAWNNVSIANLLAATVTIRFTDGTPSSDTVQDSWSIDATLLHLWTTTTDQYTAEVEFVRSSNLQNWTRMVWQIQSCWDIGQVTVTIQLYNFTLGAYASNGNGYLSYVSSTTPNTNELMSQTTTSSPNDFKNSTGHWQVKIKGVESTSAQFLMKVDWIDFTTTYSTLGSTIPYNAWQWYTIRATSASGGPIPYAYVSIYANGTLVYFQNVTDKAGIGNPAWVRLDAGGQFMLEVRSANGSGETFVLYAVVGSIVGQKTVTQEAH
jgi:hypothetical protein